MLRLRIAAICRTSRSATPRTLLSAKQLKTAGCIAPACCQIGKYAHWHADAGPSWGHRGHSAGFVGHDVVAVAHLESKRVHLCLCLVPRIPLQASTSGHAHPSIRSTPTQSSPCLHSYSPVRSLKTTGLVSGSARMTMPSHSTAVQAALLSGAAVMARGYASQTSLEESMNLKDKVR